MGAKDYDLNVATQIVEVKVRKRETKSIIKSRNMKVTSRNLKYMFSPYI